MVERLRARLGSQDGYAMLVALGVLVVTSMLVAGAFAAVQADTPLAQRDLEGKKAYYAARAGINKFLYELNQNPNYWQTCPRQDTKTAIAPGATEFYTFKPMPANGNSACDPATRSDGSNGDPITTMIDADTGTFQMQFTGYAGTGVAGSNDPEVSRGLIASFRKDTPLDFLWFTVYETLDPSSYDNPAAYADCQGYAQGRPNTPNTIPPLRASHCVEINFVSGDRLRGPSHTEDQYLVPNNNSPTFGRVNTNDLVESAVPSTTPNDICQGGNCQNAVFNGTRAPGARSIQPPADNSLLATDATKFGRVYTGVTTVVLNDTQATVTNCPSTCTTTTFTIDKFPSGVPIIYVKDGTGCNNKYSPYNVTYPASGSCGTVYVSGTYTRSLTIAAQSDVIIKGEIKRNGGAPAPTVGLTANNYVRVMHGINGRPANANSGDCVPNSSSKGTEAPGQFTTNLRIDAAILAIKHSFIVDNYDCGNPNNTQDLIVNGAIAQTYRGTVGTGGSNGASTGYLKDYNYDDRFSVAQPPYLFDIASSSWHIARETLCVPSGTASSTTCG